MFHKQHLFRRQRGSVVKARVCDQHGLSSKSICTILLYPWERHFTALSPAWWPWQAVLNFIHIAIKLKNQTNKFQLHNNILAFSEAVRGNCLPYV